LSTKKEETKKKILEVTVDLLDTIENPDNITVRKIAQAAGVGAGLINYYFESRDDLIKAAVAQKMVSMAEIMESLKEDSGNPKEYLKNVLTAMSDTAMKDRRLNKISAEYDLVKGDFKICLYLQPVLRKIYQDSKSETDLRLIAFQLIVTLQSVYLRQDAFHLLTGIDAGIKKERDNLINSIVDNLIR
jgi:AcrR family transcriptional regulator